MSQPLPPAAGSDDQPHPPRQRWRSPVLWFREWIPQVPSSSACSDLPDVSGRDGARGDVQTTSPVSVHPEEQDPGSATPKVPSSPDELIKMQRNNAQQSRPEKTGKGEPVSPKVKQALDWLADLECSPSDDKEIALAILRNLEQFHDETVEEMVSTNEGERSQLAAWAIDADRLMLCRRLLEGIEL